MRAEQITPLALGVPMLSGTFSRDVLFAQLRGLLGVILFLVLVQHTRENEEFSPVLSGGLAVASLAALGLLWWARRTLLQTLSSIPFAVVLLSLLAAATIAGTFIPQGQDEIELEERYGRFGALWIERFFLQDLFVSYWFLGLLGLLACALVLVVVRRPFWRLAHWGFTLAHGGLLLVLAGALAGKLWGERGTMDLRVGKVTNKLNVQEDGQATGEVRRLDFDLKLEAFEVEHYAAASRIQVQRLGGAEHHPAGVRTVRVDAERAWNALPSGEVKFRVREAYPDIDVERTMEATTDAAQPAAALVKLEENGQRVEKWLVSGGTTESEMTAGATTLEWAWPSSSAEASAAGAWLERTAQDSPARHLLQGPKDSAAFEVRVGESYTLPGLAQRFKVVEYIPNFYYDLKNKRGASRSAEPLNPALAIEAESAVEPGGAPQRQWLFNQNAGHGKKDPDQDITYRYVPPAPPLAHLIRLDGRTREWAYGTGGKEVQRHAFTPGQPERIALARSKVEVEAEAQPRSAVLEVVRLFEHARPKRVARVAAHAAPNPGVAIEIQHGNDPASVEEVLLSAKDGPTHTVGGQWVLALETRPPEIKAYRSQVAVMQAGQVVERATVAVNAPFQYGGYAFYQSNFRPEDLKYSGMKVVRDPGLGLVYAGLIALAAGVAFIFYVRPRLLRKAALARKEALA